MSSKPVLIGIAGGTGSGKTTVARAVYDRVGPDRIVWIAHDSYYREFGGLPMEQRELINFDHPDSLETSLLVSDLDKLIGGEPIRIPKYDFTTHSRLPETELIEPKRVILVEGILVLAEPEIRERLDIRLFVDTPADIRLMRRLTRDIRDRGRTLDSVVEQYSTHVRPMHEEFVEPSKRHADLIIPEGGENRVALDAIIGRVEQLLAG